MTTSAKRTEIARAALELIAEQGYHGAPMALIASRAGVGAGTIYRYFENKDVLITELYRELEERIYRALLTGYREDFPIRERFLHLGTTLLRYFVAHPLDFRYLEQFHNSPYGTEHRRHKFLAKSEEHEVYRRLFADALEQRQVKEFPVPILFALAFGPLLSVTRDHLLGFYPLDEAMMKGAIQACWDAVKR